MTWLQMAVYFTSGLSVGTALAVWTHLRAIREIEGRLEKLEQKAAASLLARRP